MMNATNATAIQALDLTSRPPRSPRVRLGGYTILPRTLDKARATVAGLQGAYRYDNPLDHLLFDFTNVAAETFLERVRGGADDVEMLEWVSGQSRRNPAEIASWSAWTETFTESGVEGRQWLASEVSRLDARRTDIHTIFDYLDLDDHAAFTGTRELRHQDRS